MHPGYTLTTPYWRSPSTSAILLSVCEYVSSLFVLGQVLSRCASEFMSLLSLPLAHRQMMGGAPNAPALDAWGSAKGKGKGRPGEW